jgi:hypothetical protein
MKLIMSAVNVRGLTDVGMRCIELTRFVLSLVLRRLKLLLRKHKLPCTDRFRQNGSKYEVINEDLRSTNFFNLFLLPEQWEEPVASISLPI